MTVKECIDYYKEKAKRTSRRLTSVWICPSITIKPKVGTEYTIEIALNAKLPDILSNLDVTKHWLEGSAICIVYNNTEELQQAIYSK